MKAKSLFIAALAVAALSACSKDEGQNVGSERPIFSGVINGVNTRAVDREWQADNIIGVIAGDGTTQFNVPYKVSDAGEDGSFTPEGDTYISFTSNKPETFIAYFPYSSKVESAASADYIPDEEGATSTVVTDADHQGENIDFLWSSAVGSSLNPDVNFVFRHVMSEITLNFKKGTGVNSLKDLEFTLSGLNLNGKFNVMDGTTQLVGSDTKDIKLAVGSDVTDDTETATKTAIFFPQNVSTIELTVSLGSSNYSATLELPVATSKQLLDGYNVEFEIEVNKSNLKTASGSVIGWNTQAGTCATVTAWGDHKAADAKLYDLAMSDGTFITVWDDNDASAYSTNINNLTEDQRANVVGIVYYTGGDPTADDDLLKTDYSGCTHGYILALNDMNTSYVQWQDDQYYQYYVSDEIEKMDANFRPSSYNSILISFDGTNEYGVDDKLKKALGYNNTKLLRAYNYYYADYNHKVRPIEYLDLFAAKNAAPKGSSGWYLPSPKELALTLGADVEARLHKGISGVTTQFNNIQNILSALNASQLKSSYWSSSECKVNNSQRYTACEVNINYLSNGYVNDSNKNSITDLRAVCAF